MLPSASALASRREERVQKAFSVDHHGPGDARLSQSAAGIYGESGDYVLGSGRNGNNNGNNNDDGAAAPPHVSDVSNTSSPNGPSRGECGGSPKPFFGSERHTLNCRSRGGRECSGKKIEACLGHFSGPVWTYA